MCVLKRLAALTCSLLLAAPPAEAQEPLLGWLASEGDAYESAPVLEGRVVLVLAERRSAGSLRKSIEQTCRAFDRLLPPDAVGTGEAAGPAPVLVQLEDAAALGSIKAFLGAEHPYLAAWAESGERGVGFVLEEPLVAAWLRTVPGVEKSEWKPQNELTNRLTQALLIQRAGRLPQWLTQGLAWYVEQDVRNSIHCFPFRAGFVGKKEHKGWSSTLRALVAERGERPLAMGELTDWPRGTFDERHAALAWGAGTLLAKYFPDALPGILADFTERARSGGRITHPDGSWESVPDFEIPAEEQLAILDARLETSFLEELARFARQGRSYVRPR